MTEKQEKTPPKTRMNNGHRDVIRRFAHEKITQVVDRKEENKLYKKMLKITNQVIRKKYPESEMEILRKYDVTHKDNCMRYHFPSGRVDGFVFDSQEELADMPMVGGCTRSEAFALGIDFESAFDAHTLLKKENDAVWRQKMADCNALIDSARYVEDVLAIIKLPKEIEENLTAKSTALVALSPEVIERIQADFSA